MTSRSGPTTAEMAIGTNPLARRIMDSFADLVLVIGANGAILHASAGAGLESHPGWAALVGRRWVDALAIDTPGEADRLLREASSGTSRPRELGLEIPGLGEVPFRLALSRLDDGDVIAFGTDLRPVARIQQRLLDARQAMAVDYERIRRSEAKYRVLFHVTAEGALFARGAPPVVVSANPAAASMLGRPADALLGEQLERLFAPESADALATLIGAAMNERMLARLVPVGPGGELSASAHVFREGGAALVLIRLLAVALPTVSARDAAVLRVLEVMPEAFVVTTDDFIVLRANPSFFTLVDRDSEPQVIGQPVDRWLGRPAIDRDLLLAHLRERGSLRDFQTIVRGERGEARPVAVTAVSASRGDAVYFGFMIQVEVPPEHENASDVLAGPTTQELRQLVGRVSLRDIVQSSSDLIERLCVDAALVLAGNNRAAAAQLLGLSRQTLYAKLRR